MSRLARLLDRIAERNPLVGHAPRTRTTGIQLPAPKRATASRRPQRPVDAPRIHLGPAYR